MRWDLCLATLRDSGTAAVVELPPAGTLVGIARRELKGFLPRDQSAEDLDSL